MASYVTTKSLGVALLLATFGWAIFSVSMMRIVSHPLQPLSLVLLFAEVGLSVVFLRLSEKSYRSQGRVVARLSYILSAALFGAAIFPFWVGLAFSYTR